MIFALLGELSFDIEQITEIRSARDCYFTDEETAACVDEAHKHGKRLCAHARARDSVLMCESICTNYCAIMSPAYSR